METTAIEKPRNGLAGLKHWRHDLLAGLVVSMISVPFSLGIAIASGAPPICGLTSAIIAGLVLPFLGGSYVTISGPAAGLAPALLAGMMLLGKGNLTTGYPLLLVAICLTGLVQIVLARFKAARFSAMFPSSVVEGMLAAIGLLIIAKQLPLLVGHSFHAHEFWGILAEAPSQFTTIEPTVFVIGAASFALILVLSTLKVRWLKVVPPQVFAAVFGLLLGQLLALDSKFMIHLPDKPFEHGIALPDFRGVWADHSLWWAVFTTVLTLTLIDGVESLATIAAIDKIDPFKRKSDPNRTLNAMGVSNICSSMIGGLTIIPGGVKSTTSIIAGGRTQWANFYNALFLILYLVIAKDLINLLPLSTLGAIIIFTGYKLCAPKVWKHVAHIGGEQLFVFTATVLVTLSTDLLWGIAAGMLTKLALEIWIEAHVQQAEGRAPVLRRFLDRAAQAGELFRNPVVQKVETPEGYHLYFARPMVCFNTMYLNDALARVPATTSCVYLHVTDLVTFIDHTTTATLLEFVEEFKRSGRGLVEVLGLERLRPRSHDRLCMRVSPPLPAVKRAEALQAMTRLSLTAADAAPVDQFLALAHLSLTSPARTAAEDLDHPITAFLTRAGARGVARVRSAAAFLRAAFHDGTPGAADARRELTWLGLSPPAARDVAPANALGYFSLTTPDHQSRSRLHVDGRHSGGTWTTTPVEM
jgi:MFS superfamily sulfate permease-like transporter